MMIEHVSTPDQKRAAPGRTRAAALTVNYRGAFVAALALIALGAALPARAATPCATVTSTADDPSSSVTSGTLRYAIWQVNTGTCDTVAITASGTITLTQGQLEIGNTVLTGVTISGPGAANLAISGNNASRVFFIYTGVTTSISGITIKNGYNDVNDDSVHLSGYGGGILNSGALTITGSTLSGNRAQRGGGILNFRALTVTNSTFSGNSGSLYGGGIASVGNSRTTITDSTFSGNTGSGIVEYASTVTVSSSTFSGTVTNAYSSGDGIEANGGTVTVTNSTFSANSGGGISNDSGTLTITNSTLAGNSSYAGGGGILNLDEGTVMIKNTLLANTASGGDNCLSDGSTILSAGYNLSDGGSCTSYFTATGDLNNAPAGLQTDSNGNVLLKDNGGPTQTIALVLPSIAIDRIPSFACTDATGNPLYTDQRGVARPQPTGGYCDVGAFELVPSTPFASFTPKLNIYTGAVSAPGFDLNVALTLGTNNTAIFPLAKDVNLTIGSYIVTVPAGSFKLLTNGSKAGGYTYTGTINGVTLTGQLSPTGTNSYVFTASATGVVPATSNPVPVTISIGTDSSTASVTARIK
jgi:hypothetical protein